MNEEKQRMLELLSEQVIFGLNEKELMELEQLKIQFPDWNNYASFEIAAAAIGMSDVKLVAMPENLRTKILNNAENYFSSPTTVREVVNAETKNEPTLGLSGTAAVGRDFGVREKRPFWQWLGWGVAATAGILLAINLWTTRFQPQPEIVKEVKVVQTPTPELSALQKREQLIAAAPDIFRTKLESPKNATDISGDVVWSNSLQKGYVTFRNLPVNDPAKNTYQLWIFDKTQNDKYPVSAGVFNVNEKGEVVVPLDTELKIVKPEMFAVTEEKPGGVVVSDREKLLAVGKV